MSSLTIRGTVIGRGTPKICIPVVGKDDGEILAQAGEALRSGAQLVEWRVDQYLYAGCPERVSRVLKDLRGRTGNIPLIFTCRTCFEGGAGSGDMDAYIRLNILAVKSGMADVVDVEIRRGRPVFAPIMEAAHQNGVYVIGSYHDFKATPSCEAMTALMQEISDSGADIVKLAVMPGDPGDVLRLLKATWLAGTQGIRQPRITMSMGDMGSISRVCGEYFGSAVTFGQAGSGSAPGQFDAKELQSVLNTLHKKASHSGEDINVREPEPGTQAGSDREGLLFLVGFMGTGKSSVAAALHGYAGMPVIEMDGAIEAREGRSIPEIFQEDGEAAFRDMETAFLKETAALRPAGAVVSCGGGVTLRPENVELMRSSGYIILLTATPRTVFERVGDDQNRPNLKNRKSIQDIEALMQERRESYETAADMVIATDGKTTEQICREIIKARESGALSRIRRSYVQTILPG